MPSPAPVPIPALTLAVVSGKGGVGKSVVAANLAEALAARGRRVALLDADAGQGAAAVLLNETPAATVADVAAGRAAAPAALHRTAAGLTLVEASAEPLAGGTPSAALTAALDGALGALRPAHDVVLIDAPAGADGLVRWALDRADAAALVVVGEPTAVADAYRLAKLVWAADAAYPLLLVVNAADGEADAVGVADRFGAVTERFMGRRAEWLGWLPFSPAMRAAVRAQTPAVRTPGPLADAFAALADAVDARRAEPVSAETSVAEPMGDGAPPTA